MVEIKCSRRQKETIIAALKSPQGCLWPQKTPFCATDPKASCDKCFRERIKWIHPQKTE